MMIKRNWFWEKRGKERNERKKDSCFERRKTGLTIISGHFSWIFWQIKCIHTEGKKEAIATSYDSCSLSLSISSCLNFFFYSWSLDPVQESGSCLLVFIVLLREESLPTFSFISLSMINLFLYKLPTFSCYLYVVFSYFCLSFKPTWKSSCLLFNVIAVFPPLISFTQMNGLECYTSVSPFTLSAKEQKETPNDKSKTRKETQTTSSLCRQDTSLSLLLIFKETTRERQEWVNATVTISSGRIFFFFFSKIIMDKGIPGKFVWIHRQEKRNRRRNVSCLQDKILR